MSVIKSRGGCIRTALESKWALPACLILGFVLRLVWVLAVNNQQMSDWAWYYDRALTIADGSGYSIDGRPTAYWPVGYPAFLGMLFVLFEPSELVGKLGNIFEYMGIITLSFLLAREFFKSKLAAGLTALLLAVYPNHIYYTSVLLSETFYTLLTLLGIFILTKAKSRLWLGAVAGAVLGYAILTREQGYLVPTIAVLAFGWSTLKKGAWKPVLLMLMATNVGAMVVVIPWTVRNYTVFGHVIPVSTNPGVNLFLGNNPRATGGNICGPGLFSVLKGGTNEWEWDYQCRQYAIQYMRQHPLRTLKLVPLRLIYTYRWDWDAFNWIHPEVKYAEILRWPCRVFYTVVMGLFGIAVLRYLITLRRKSPGSFPTLGLLLVMCWAAVNLLTYGSPRYHYAAMPWIVMYAAAMIAGALPYCKPRRMEDLDIG